ncbi:MAG: N-acylglucosamine 2-epimerase [Ruminococcaceae bacterium]|nr:N-acylglucosamine 2-epimerase [Oscillospiraceae bacterium]
MKELANKYYKIFKEELFESCVPFWLENGRDMVNGGILNCLDRYGKVYSTDKSVWMQGRTAWTYSYISNSFGKNEEYLDFAKSCLDFENKHCFDSDGRMFFTVTADGKPLRKRRYWFSETFYIIGSAEYYMATGDKTSLENAKSCFDFVYGMYCDPKTDPFKITPKSYAETRSMKSLGRPMIMLNVTSIMRKADPENEEKYNAIIDNLINDIRCFYKPQLKGMLEAVTQENEYLSEVSEGRIINPGHCIECAWFLLDEGIYRGDEELKKFAATVFDDAIARGWDSELGGIFYFKDAEGKPIEAYEHDMKLWWPHNEAIIASLMLYRETGEEKYRDWFEKITEYAFAHFSDRANGEWLGYLRRDGKPTEPPCKGHTYKGAFHVMRMLAKVLNIFDEASKE